MRHTAPAKKRLLIYLFLLPLFGRATSTDHSLYALCLQAAYAQHNDETEVAQQRYHALSQLLGQDNSLYDAQLLLQAKKKGAASLLPHESYIRKRARSNPALLAHLAQGYIQQHAPKKAILLYLYLTTLYPHLPTYAIQALNLLISASCFDEADELLSQLQDNPTTALSLPSFYLLNAKILLGKKEWLNAYQLTQRALPFAPQHPAFYTLHAAAATALGNIHEAIESYRTYLLKHPDPEVLRSCLMLMLDTNRISEAEALLQGLTVQTPYHVTAQARIALKKKQYKQGLLYAFRALEQTPSNQEACSLAVQALLHLQHPERAFSLLIRKGKAAWFSQPSPFLEKTIRMLLTATSNKSTRCARLAQHFSAPLLWYWAGHYAEKEKRDNYAFLYYRKGLTQRPLTLTHQALLHEALIKWCLRKGKKRLAEPFITQAMQSSHISSWLYQRLEKK